MKNIKRILLIAAALTITVGMVSCGDKASSAEEAEVKVDGGDNASIADSKEEIKDSVAVTEDSSEVEDDSEVVKSNSDREHWYGTNGWLSVGVSYDLDGKYYDKGIQSTYSFSHLSNEQKAFFSTITGIHSNNPEIVFDISNSSDWLTQSKPYIMQSILEYTFYKYDLVEEADSDFLIIDSEEEIEINEKKYIKFTAHFDCKAGGTLTSETADGPINCIGYITVIQDERSADLVEPDVVGWFVCEPADTADLVFMEENVKHAAETLTIEE